MSAKSERNETRPKSRWRHIGVGLVVSLLAPLLLTTPVGAITITAANDLDVTQVVLNDNGTVITQNASVVGTADADSDPVDLLEITINDGGTSVVLDEFNVGSADVDAANFGFPAGLTGVRTWENGVATELADPGFEAALERVLTSTDLRDYIAYDTTSLPGSSWAQDYDVLFGAPLDNDDYLVVSERNGNTFFDLIPLDVNGNPIPGHEVIGFDAPYGWNTGFAPAEFATQPQWFSVTDVQEFGIDTSVTPIWGFRVDNDGEADVKFFSAGVDPFTVPSSIAGSVLDDSGNAIPGVTITLTGTDVFGNPVTAETTTDADGNYSFTGLHAGTYTVTETQPAGYDDGPDAVGTAGGDDSVNDVFSAISLGEGVDAIDYDFVETVPVVGATISGSVYVDANSDGAFDAGESGIAGVVITLTGTDESGNPVTAETTTDADGNYSFTGLNAGTYTVSEAQPAGYDDGADTPGSLGGDASVNDVISSIVLAAGDNSIDNDFGEVLAATPDLTGTIGGLVWRDADSDGQFDAGETLVSSVTVRLLDEDGNVVATTGTNTSGEYLFTGLPAGRYTVEVVPPTGDDLTVANQGNDATDSDFTISTGRVGVTLAAGGAVSNIDAGLVEEPATQTPPELALTGVDSWVMALIAFTMIGFGLVQVRLSTLAASGRIRFRR